MDKKTALQTTEPKVKTKWLAILVWALLSFLVVLLWWSLNNKKNADYYKITQVEAINLSSYINTDLRSRILTLKRIVNRWEFRRGTPKDEFINDVQAYVSDTPGFQAIEWVDKTYHVRWIIPAAGNERTQDLNLAFEENRRIALEKSRNRRTPTMTSVIDLVQGGKGFQVYFPIFVHGEFDGFVLASFRTQEWLAYVFDVKSTPEELEFFKITVSMDGSPVFKETGWDAQKSSLEASETTDIMDHRFKILLRPTEVFFQHNRTAMNEVIAAGGLLLSVLVSAMIYLSQKAVEETWRTHAAKKSLEAAISELNETKNELQYANARLIV